MPYCKDKYAESQSVPMLNEDIRQRPYKQCNLIRTRHLRKIALDNVLGDGIITFTHDTAQNRIPNAPKTSQTRSLARSRIAKSPASGRDRPAVCQRQLFRSQGSCPSQVRDAAPSAERGPVGNRCRHGFRLFATVVLSSFVGARTGRACCIGSAQTRPQTSSQADQRDYGFYSETRKNQPDLRIAELGRLIQERFGITVHPRSIQRSLLRHQKKRR